MRALAILILLLAFAPEVARAEVRFAAVSGSGDACSEAVPCPLPLALSGANSGDEVVVGAGTYGGDLSNTILGVPSGVAVRGAVVGPGRPVLTAGLALNGAGTSVRDVEMRRTGSGPALYLGGGAAADRVIARLGATDADDDGCVVTGGSSLRNSVCTAARTDNLSALAVRGSSTVRNVTAVGAAYGMYIVDASVAEAVIAQGGTQEDVFNNSEDNVFRDVLYGDVQGDPPADDQGRVILAAAFRGADDFRQAPGSPTIDAGDLENASTAATDLDLDGNLRRMGAQVDIGAYEQVLPPAAVAGAQTTTTADGAVLAGTVDTGGAARGEAFFEFGPGFAETTPVQALPTVAGPIAVTAPVTGLGDTPTPYRLVVTTEGGTDRSDDQVAYRAPGLTAVEPSAVEQTTATLNGTVALKGAPSATVEFVHGAATSPPQTITADGPVKADLTGLSPNTTYQWKLRVTRGGEIFETALGTFKTKVAEAPPAGTPSPSPSPTPPDPTASITGGAKKAGRLLLRRKRLSVLVRCGDAPCAVRAVGVVRVGKRRYGVLAAPSQPLRLGAGERGRITLTANRRLRRRVARALLRRPKVKAVARLRVIADQAGERTVRRFRVRIRRS